MNDNYQHAESSVFYITENILGPFEESAEYEQLSTNYNSQLHDHCSCNDICSPATCECLQKSGGDNYVAYKLNGQLKYKLTQKEKPYPILECSESCPCSKDCGNRTVQNGPIDGLQIKECDKGLGLFATSYIPSGTFICEYAGELITSSQAALRHCNNKAQGKRNYVFCLRELSNNNQSLVTIIDPSVFGNIGRYINHSCEPNCYVIPIRCDCPVPKLGIFAMINIQPNEELTFHYGISDEMNHQTVADKTMCLCKTRSCSGFMPFHIF